MDIDTLSWIQVLYLFSPLCAELFYYSPSNYYNYVSYM